MTSCPRIPAGIGALDKELRPDVNGRGARRGSQARQPGGCYVKRTS